MLTLFKKEIQTFFGSLIGYIVITVFLTAIGLLMWVFPGNMNVLESGYANINTLFNVAPWVFMFLIPAITMRSFAEEKSVGTIELLLTKPLSDLQIILAKFFAGMSLVIISLLPTLVYYFSISQLGNPPGNVDTGGMWGSYLGLIFLSSGFVAIGIFASSLTQNQIVSFVLAVILSLFFFIGFEMLSSISLFTGIDYVLINLGINAHYISMSRGVIDTRDVLYFISLSALFILFTKTVLNSRKW